MEVFLVYCAYAELLDGVSDHPTVVKVFATETKAEAFCEGLRGNKWFTYHWEKFKVEE